MERDLDLRPGARKIIDEVLRSAGRFGRDQPNGPDWLTAISSRNPGMLADLLEGAAESILSEHADSIALEVVLERATLAARSRDSAHVSERDLIGAVLQECGHEPAGIAAAVSAPPAEASTASNLPLGPTLAKYGRDLTAEARLNQRAAVSGRDDEIELIVETLCRAEKRNPLLVGPAGTGKTAIVEGLAQRVAASAVPAFLKDVHVVGLELSALIGGTSYVGEFEKRMEQILEEASRPDVILFVDEAHALTAVGGRMDIGNILKPALARGDIAVIAATTDEEYRQSIEKDAALARRFQKIEIGELDRAATRTILEARSAFLGSIRKISVPAEIIDWAIEFADRSIPNRPFPDKAIDVLEQAVGHAVANARDSVTLADAHEVAERFVGVPKSAAEAIGAMRDLLTSRTVLGQEQVAHTVARLNGSLRQLDAHSDRPDLALLLTGPDDDSACELAGEIADAMFSDRHRVISIDLSRIQHSTDLSMLIGAPAGYVGYEDRLELQRLAEVPWSVVVFRNVDACHPTAAQLVAGALRDGSITDAKGRRYSFARAVVICTARQPAAAGRQAIGFAPSNSRTDERAASERAHVTGTAVDGLFDAVIDTLHDPVGRANAVQSLLSDISARFSRRNVTVEWDATVAEWLEADAPLSKSDAERFADEALVGPIAQATDGSPTTAFQVRVEAQPDGRIAVTETRSAGASAPVD